MMGAEPYDPNAEEEDEDDDYIPDRLALAKVHGMGAFT
jgi:hypothetical protein